MTVDVGSKCENVTRVFGRRGLRSFGPYYQTAVIDVEFALPPKVRMSFLQEKKDVAHTVMEDLDLACGQALN